MSKGSLFIISGPSGVGKGSVVREIMKQRTDMFLSVSCTTRAPREGEVEGKNYYYISQEEFEKRIGEGYFVEWNYYVDHYYGTPAQPVTDAAARGESTILEIDVNGALKAKKAYPEAVLVFVVPPDNDVLRKRLTGRDKNSDIAVLERRIARAKEEYGYIEQYDHVIVNAALEDCVADLNAIIESERSRVKNNPDILKNLLED